MRNKDLSGGEWPVTKMWYGKMAGHTIEDIIENNVSYFIWMVKAFQDVTVKQAKFFRDKWGMDLPEEVIKDVPPYTYSRKAPEKEYESLCEGLIDIKDTYMVKLQSSRNQTVKTHSPNRLDNIPRSRAIPPPKDAPKGSDEYKRWLYSVYGRNKDILPNYDFDNQRDP